MIKHRVEIALSSSELKMLRKHAKEREALHKSHDTSRPLSKDYEHVGLIGEYAFQLWSNLPMDFELRPGGDCKFDFVTADGLTIDVKTARKAYNLFREEGKPHADILVLAGVQTNKYDDDTVMFYGWEYGVTMLMQDKKDFGYGIINHYKSRDGLRSMHDLKGIIDNGLKAARSG